jgi:uncharacterized membrane protein
MKNILFAILFSALQSCTYNVDKTVEAPQNAALTAPETKITFDFIKTDTTAVCLKCHSGRVEPELSTKESLIANMSEVLGAVMSNEMPPPKKFASLTACQKAALQKWFDLGAPDESEVTLSSLPECT